MRSSSKTQTTILDRLDQLERRAADDIDKDPVQFALDYGVTLDPWQRKAIGSTASRKIVLAGRQTGKTELGAVLAVHKLLDHKGSTVLIVSSSQDQSKIAFRRAKALLYRTGTPLRSDQQTSLITADGSMLVALPAVERTTRGYSVHRLIIDEAAGLDDDTYFALLPSLMATGGDRVLLGTPRGRTGYFHDIYHSDDPKWYRDMVLSTEITREPMATLVAEERESVPPFWFQQEYLCEFLAQENDVFDPDLTRRSMRTGEDSIQIGAGRRE